LTDDGFEALRAQLGGTPPDGLRQLESEQLADLADAVQEARRRQGRAISEAGDRAFAMIPRLLRGPIRRIVG
jgi:hypothetical protein